MSGGVIEKATGDNNEEYNLACKNFHFNPNRRNGWNRR